MTKGEEGRWSLPCPGKEGVSSLITPVLLCERALAPVFVGGRGGPLGGMELLEVTQSGHY